MSRRERIVSPFRGIRYAVGEQGDLSDLMAPPYDIISVTMAEELRARHAHNFVRLELPQKAESDREESERYRRAAATLRQWLGEGVLAREEELALYLLEQEFQMRGRRRRRRGVFGLVRLPSEGEEYVLPHEGTLPEPKTDRLRLMRSCQAMTSPIMMMHEDREGELIQLMQGAEGEPDAVGRDGDGVVHRLWVLRDREITGAICEAIGAGPLFIADGHHRFETAMAHRDEMREVHPEEGEAGFGYALALVTSAKDEGLEIFPTHRLVACLDQDAKERMKARMREYFEVHEWALPDPQSLGRQPWLEGIAADRHMFGAYCGDGSYYVLTARDEMLAPARSVVDGLDVRVLHQQLIDPMLLDSGPAPDADGRVSHDSHTTQPAGRCARLTYVTDEQEAIAAVGRGDYDFALFLRPTRVSDVLAAARAGERMPGKSTYFYPKAPAGIVLSDASAEPI